jgi:hypothetical protein
MQRVMAGSIPAIAFRNSAVINFENYYYLLFLFYKGDNDVLDV